MLTDTCYLAGGYLLGVPSPSPSPSPRPGVAALAEAMPVRSVGPSPAQDSGGGRIRLPPDGHEFPPRYHDPLVLPTSPPHPVLESMKGSGSGPGSGAPPPLPRSAPPAAAPPPPPSAPAARRYSLEEGWRKDERSERSVRDKIAMFTSAAEAGSAGRRLPSKFKSSEDVFQVPGDAADGGEVKLRSRSIGKSSPDVAFSSSSSTSSSGSSAYSSFCSPDSSLSPGYESGLSSTLPRKKPLQIRATSFNNGTFRPTSTSTSTPASEESRRASLTALVEQRRRSISKLRGLVIPDKVPEASISIPDLPEIRSRDAILICNPAACLPGPPPNTAPRCAAPPPPAPVLSSPPWKSQGSSNLPKYSPAFKRKSLTLRSARNEVSKASQSPSSPTRSDSSFEFLGPSRTASVPRGAGSHHDLIADSPKSAFLSDSGRSAEEESDNDSAVSSSRSSISHGFSPPASPLLPASVGAQGMNGRHSDVSSAIRRTLSSDTTASTITSSSQVSCSSNSSSNSNGNGNICHLDSNRRILKAQSVDAINRKNVLFSARCRSGRNLKAGSPPIQRKAGIRDPREEIRELERMVSMADTDDDSVHSSDDTLEPSRIHYRTATLRDLQDLPTADVKVAFLNDSQNGVELELHPVSPPPATSPESLSPKENGFSSSLFNKGKEEPRKPMELQPVLARPLSRKSSTDSQLATSDVPDNAPSDLNLILAVAEETSESPRQRSLKKRNASDPLILERNNSRNISTSGTGLQAVSVNDIRKAFEKAELALSPTTPSPPFGKMGCNGTSNGSLGERLGSGGAAHVRGSSIDSTTSDDNFSGHLSREQFGSITSLASTTSLISQQELQQLIDDANQTLEEANNCATNIPGASHEVLVVILHRETAGASVGITLAGGADYETKEITVHKVLSGSPAERDGRLQKGDRILSINGRNMKGVTHRESLAILKAPRPEVVLVVSRSRGEVSRAQEDNPPVSCRLNTRPPRILEQPSTDVNEGAVPRGPAVNIVLQKDGAGLGFSLEGGKDSPLGDRPLTVKKIFTGGCAEKSGCLQAGDELLCVNNADVTQMSRIEAWGLMKRLPNGSVTLTVRHARSPPAES